MSQLLLQAAVLATKYHSMHPLAPENAFRKSKSGGIIPYVVHVFDVVKLLSGWGVIDEATLVTGVGHDLFEDTRMTYELMVESFGKFIADIIVELSFKPADGISNKEKAAQKANKMESYRTSSIRAYVVKIADRLSNVMDFFHDGETEYALKYFHKADALWDVLTTRKSEIVELYGEMVYANIVNSINEVFIAIGGNPSEQY